MIPYFLHLAWTTLLAFWAERRAMPRFAAIALAGILILSLVLFAGLRAVPVGADTIAYVNRYEYLVGNGLVWDADGTAEVGHKLLFAIARLLSDDWSVALIVTSAFAIFFYLRAITRLAASRAIAIFTFIAFGYFVFHMNGLRQGIALAVYLNALPALIAGRPGRYAFWAILASCFHITAIFTLLAYPLLRERFSARAIFLLLTIGAVALIGLDAVFGLAGLANERYESYAERTETGGALLALFYGTMSVFFIVMRPIIRPQWARAYDVFLLMLVLGATIHAMVSATGIYIEISRMALYFHAGMIFLWPIAILSLPDRRSRAYMLLVMAALGGAFYFVYLREIGNLIPYQTA
ncbi:EpsG family protein [Alteriqipengyuania lutimaris]|uniref:EpsG family protein n=1 Tax=Alteriqipengyuania lutimaris TaxID=1538146 RepID=A0A395LJ77_9SPHN|nr:EpsG family protein [Alteriqipengyuania lutimaris]MBB3034379.1 hypothetical protein [Alteriqipengyuania lutimaris]RDS76719.1 EpsG family protein [Alteriqipengyuania lutimaris]